MQSSRRIFTRQDTLALLAIALFLIINLIASWQRWTQPIIDHGREMNLPARVLAGEQLYVDIQFLYGPFAPYFNALLYRLFGIHLSTLHASGAACAVLILLMIYWLARQLMGVWEAALTTGLVLVVCAIKSTANYISPYAYAALYSLVFSLGSLVATTRYLQTRILRYLVYAGLFTGLSGISKPESALPALVAAGAALIIAGISKRKIPWRDAVVFALPMSFIIAGIYGLILSRVPLRVLLEDNHILFTNMPPQLYYFNRQISGLAEWPKSLWYTASGLGLFAGWIGLSSLIGALISRLHQSEWRTTAKRALFITGAGAVWWLSLVLIFKIKANASPLTAAPIVLPLLIGVLVGKFWRSIAEQRGIPPTDQILLVVTVFAFTSTLRSIINVSTTTPYASFFVPVMVIVYLFLLFRWFPERIATAVAVRKNIQRVAMTLVALMIIGTAINTIYRFRSRNTFMISTPRGSFITEPPVGQPIAAAISYVNEHTSPNDYVLTLPQATMINFLTERRYPLREEIIHPGFLAGEKESEAIGRIKSRRVPLILVINLLTPEFRDRVFGADYNQELMRWIVENYQLKARFDSDYSRNAKFGDKDALFILAYEGHP